MYSVREHEYGMTLIELLAVITIVAALLWIAVPNFHDMMESVRFSGAVNKVRSDLLRARINAIETKESYYYTVAFQYNDNQLCGSNPCDYIIFADKNNNAHLDTDEEVLKIGIVRNLSDLYPGVHITCSFPGNHVTFNGDFRVDQGGTIQIQTDTGKRCKKITVTPIIGRIGEPEECS